MNIKKRWLYNHLFFLIMIISINSYPVSPPCISVQNVVGSKTVSILPLNAGHLPEQHPFKYVY